jgi:hypothetical protein
MTQNTITAGGASDLISFQGGDDGTLVIKTGPSGSKVNAVSYAADGTPTFLKVPLNAAVQSMVRVNTSNGYGSTNTFIRRFTNVVTNQGSDITYADSATLGASFTINTNGVYAISYSDSFSATANLGISFNSSQLTTSILSINVADRLNSGTTLNTNPTAVSSTLYIPAGSVIRAHTDSTGGGTVALVQFTIVRAA